MKIHTDNNDDVVSQDIKDFISRMKKGSMKDPVKNLIGSFIPSDLRQVKNMDLARSRQLGSRLHDVLHKVVSDGEELITIPLLVTRQKVKNAEGLSSTIQHVIQTKVSEFGYDRWKAVINGTVRRLAEDSVFLPTVEDISALLEGDKQLAASVDPLSISKLFSGSVDRKYRDSIISRLVRENWRFHLEDHLSMDSTLAELMNMRNIRELGGLYDELFAKASTAGTPKSQMAVINEISNIMSESDIHLNPEAAELLTGLVTLAERMTLSNVVSVTLPRRVVQNIMADLELVSKCLDDVVIGSTVDLPNVKEMIHRPLVSENIQVATYFGTAADAFSFINNNGSSNRSPIMSTTRAGFKDVLQSMIDDYLKGKGTLEKIKIKRMLDGPGGHKVTDEMYDELQDFVLDFLWMQSLPELMTNGLIRSSNPLYLKIQVTGEDINQLAPSSLLVTSALSYCYDLMTSANRGLISMFDYEAIDGQWSPESRTVLNMFNDAFSQAKMADELIGQAHILSTLPKLIPDSPVYHISFNGLSDVYKTTIVEADEISLAKQRSKSESRVVVYDNVESRMLSIGVSVLKGMNDNVLSLLARFGLEGSTETERMWAEMLIKSGNLMSHTTEVTWNTNLGIDMPQWLVRLISLTSPNTKDVLKLEDKLRRAGLPFSWKLFTTKEEFLSYLGGGVDEELLKDYGFDILDYVHLVADMKRKSSANRTSKSGFPVDTAKVFLIVDINPVVIHNLEYSVSDAIMSEGVVRGVAFAKGQYGSLLNLMPPVAPVGYIFEDLMNVRAESTTMVVPAHIFSMEKITVGSFTKLNRHDGSEDRITDDNFTSVTVSDSGDLLITISQDNVGSRGAAKTTSPKKDEVKPSDKDGSEKKEDNDEDEASAE